MWNLLKECWQVLMGSWWMPAEPGEWCCGYHMDMYCNDFTGGIAIKVIRLDGSVRRIDPNDFYKYPQRLTNEKVWVDEWREIPESVWKD